MNPTSRRGSLRTDLAVAVVVTFASGSLLVALSAAGWLATKVSLPGVVALALVIGAAAGIASSRRKQLSAAFSLRRPTK